MGCNKRCTYRYKYLAGTVISGFSCCDCYYSRKKGFVRSKFKADETKYNGYFTKYILERVYDKVVEWITFNHLTLKNEYIEIKQEEICSLIYGLGIGEEYKTPEFKKRICNWTREVIEHLVQIREVYSEN